MTFAAVDLSRRKAIPTHLEPGSLAPVAGVYQELNVLGGLTGRWRTVKEGEQLPRAPIMFSWRLVFPFRKVSATDAE
jgi:hypothetical protein